MQNTIERAVILTESGRPVTSAALGLPGDFSAFLPPAPPEPEILTAPTSVTVSARTVTDEAGGVLTIAILEKQAIQAALLQTKSNRTQAAALLGISIRTLRNKLQEYRTAGSPLEAELDSNES